MAEFKWYGDKATAKAMQAAIQALGACAANLQEESLKQVPWATGDLGGSCNISDPIREGNTVWVKVGYSTEYAVKQHEDLSLRHPDPRNPLSVPGRKAKYLEDPFKANAAKYERFIKNAVQRALAKE